MSWTQEHRSNAVILTRARLRANDGPALEDVVAQLLEQGHLQVVVDLTTIGTLDSSEVAEMNSTLTRVQHWKGQIVFALPPEGVEVLKGPWALTDCLASSREEAIALVRELNSPQV